MASPWYLNPAAGGTDSGTQANPYKSQASLIGGGISAGDIIYWTGIETLTGAATAWPTSGTAAAPIQIISTDSSWNYEKGTGGINANGQTNALNLNSKGFIIVTGMKTYGASGDNITGGSNRCYFFEVESYSAGGYGIYCNSTFQYMIDCYLYSNTTAGAYLGGRGLMSGCFLTLNGKGVILESGDHIEDTTSVNNTTSQIEFLAGNYGTVTNCTASGGNYGIVCGAAHYVKNTLISKAAIEGINGTGSHLATLNNVAMWDNTLDVAAALIVVYHPYQSTLIAIGSDPYVTFGTDWSIARPNTDLLDVEVSVGTQTDYVTIGSLTPTIPTASTPTFAGLTGGQMVSDGSLRLEWAAGSGGTHYVGYVSTSAITYAVGERACMVNFGINKMTIFQTGAGTPLVPGTFYYFAVRLEKIGTSAEDTNTVTGQYTCVGRGTAPQYIKQGGGLY